MKDLSLRSIATAAAMTGALILGAQAQAQTTNPYPTNAAGMNSDTPDGPNSRPAAMMERNAAKPGKSGADVPTNAAGMNATTPDGPNSRPATMMERDTANPGRSGAAVPSNAAGMNALIPDAPMVRPATR